MIDALTTLAIVTGLTIDVGLTGDLTGAIAGTVAFLTVASGLFMISAQLRAAGSAIDFDIVKGHLRCVVGRRLMNEWLIHLTMRDFFAVASTIMILARQAHLLLFIFAVAAMGWLVVTIASLWQISTAERVQARTLPDVSECT